MTETGMLTSNPYDAYASRQCRPAVARRAVAGLRPGQRRKFVSGEIGMIEVAGPNVFSGYWRMPEKTAEEFRPDGFFITGDLGNIDHTAMSTSSAAAKT